MLYELVLVTDPPYYSENIYNPSNFGFIKKTKKIKIVPISTITEPNTNLEHLELLRPWGSQRQLPPFNLKGQ